MSQPEKEDVTTDERDLTTICTSETEISDRYRNVFSHIASSLKWCPTSEGELAKAEEDLLSSLARPFTTFFVDIGDGWGNKSNKIRTLTMLTPTEEAERAKSSIEAVRNKPKQAMKHPLVLVHGFAAGIGFGRSTRAPFDLSGDVERQFVDSMERWRIKMGFDKMILLGHSFGGYLCASYALTHPNRVSHLILADPWGIQDRAMSPNINNYRFPIWVRVVSRIFQHFNPLAALRASGPCGPVLLHKLRPDLREKFRPKLNDDGSRFLDYIYHCNAQSATGESAFKKLSLLFGWPKNPLIHRLINLNQSVSLTFIYGARSWIDKAPGEILRDCMSPGQVSLHVILNSGHHVYADRYEEFNNIVRDTCNKIPN